VNGVDMVQGLLEWYPIKTVNAIRTEAIYLKAQGLLCEQDYQNVMTGLEQIEATGEPINLPQIIEERNVAIPDLIAQLATVSECFSSFMDFFFTQFPE
jgi:hypothetical protein